MGFSDGKIKEMQKKKIYPVFFMFECFTYIKYISILHSVIIKNLYYNFFKHSTLLNTGETWSSWGGSSEELWRWLSWVWVSWSSFSLRCPPCTELCIDNWKGVDNPIVCGLLLSSAGTASGLFLQLFLSPSRGCGWARPWERTQSGQLTKTVPRAIPYHMTSAGM